MGGGHNSHASGLPKRRGVESNSRASQFKSCENLSTASVTLALKTDITSYAMPSDKELNEIKKDQIKVRTDVL